MKTAVRLASAPAEHLSEISDKLPLHDADRVLLEAVWTELRAVRALLEARRDRRDDDQDASLLLAVAAAVKETAFSAGEVIRHARIVEDLQAALTAAGVTTGRRLGKRFRRLAGRELCGLRLMRLGADRDGVIWRVSRV